jgi:predicted RNA-binding Zn ribbon-like protein
MDFDNYQEEALDTAIDLANSLDVVSGEEYLTNVDAVGGWLQARGIETQRPPTERDVTGLRRLRAEVRIVMEGSNEDAEEALERIVAGASVRPRVTFSEGGWRLSYVAGADGLVNRVAAVAVTGLASALSESGRDRFGVCSKDGCRDLYLDTSKNRSRRYCSDSCSNRANVAAFRARQKAPEGKT